MVKKPLVKPVMKKEDELEKKPSIESLEDTITHEIELTDTIMSQKMELADKTRQIAVLEKNLVNNKIKFGLISNINFNSLFILIK